MPLSPSPCAVPTVMINRGFHKTGFEGRLQDEINNKSQATSEKFLKKGKEI